MRPAEVSQLTLPYSRVTLSPTMRRPFLSTIVSARAPASPHAPNNIASSGMDSTGIDSTDEEPEPRHNGPFATRFRDQSHVIIEDVSSRGRRAHEALWTPCSIRHRTTSTT